jgi:hypothetical protein
VSSQKGKYFCRKIQDFVCEFEPRNFLSGRSPIKSGDLVLGRGERRVSNPQPLDSNSAWEISFPLENSHFTLSIHTQT